MTFVLLALACGLAFANGANDNCKGVAALVSAREATIAVVGAGLARDRRGVHLRVVRDIVLAWIVTLPAGALLAFVTLRLIR